MKQQQIHIAISYTHIRSAYSLHSPHTHIFIPFFFRSLHRLDGHSQRITERGFFRFLIRVWAPDKAVNRTSLFFLLLLLLLEIILLLFFFKCNLPMCSSVVCRRNSATVLFARVCFSANSTHESQFLIQRLLFTRVQMITVRCQKFKNIRIFFLFYTLGRVTW